MLLMITGVHGEGVGIWCIFVYVYIGERNLLFVNVVVVAYVVVIVIF